MPISADSGVALRRIVVHGRDGVREIGFDLPLLGAGWHGADAADGCRWTDGEAVLPEAAFAHLSAPLTIALHLGTATRYPRPAAPRCAAA